MKLNCFLLAGILFLSCATNAQLKTTTVCPPFDVDILEGRVNLLQPNTTKAEVENKFPCFSSNPAETTGETCGGVFFKDKDLYFFTERDYIEIGENFKGKMSVPLIGAKRGSLFTTLGNPSIKDVNWDAYQTKFGILILYYNAEGKTNKIQFSTRNAEILKLCE